MILVCLKIVRMPTGNFGREIVIDESLISGYHICRQSGIIKLNQETRHQRTMSSAETVLKKKEKHKAIIRNLFAQFGWLGFTTHVPQNSWTLAARKSESYILASSPHPNFLVWNSTCGGFLKWGYPQIIHFNRIFH